MPTSTPFSTFSTYKDHLILAADGSDINIPTTAETLKLYGSAKPEKTQSPKLK